MEVDIVSPLLLNASLVLVLTTDYSDWLVQVDVVGPLLLNASLVLVLTTDYSDWLVHVTQLIDNFLTIVWLNNIELTDWINLLILFEKWNHVFKNLQKWTIAVFLSCFR